MKKSLIFAEETLRSLRLFSWNEDEEEKAKVKSVIEGWDLTYVEGNPELTNTPVRYRNGLVEVWDDLLQWNHWEEVVVLERKDKDGKPYIRAYVDVPKNDDLEILAR